MSDAKRPDPRPEDGDPDQRLLVDLEAELLSSSETLVVLHLACDLADSPAREFTGKRWQPTQHVSEEESCSIADQFEAGQKVADLVLATGRSGTEVLRHLKLRGADTNYVKLDESRMDELMRRYEAGESTPQLAAELGVHKDTVRRRLVARGAHMRDGRFASGRAGTRSGKNGVPTK